MIDPVSRLLPCLTHYSHRKDAVPKLKPRRTLALRERSRPRVHVLLIVPSISRHGMQEPQQLSNAA
jgi:hypothetical protein